MNVSCKRVWRKKEPRPVVELDPGSGRISLLGAENQLKLHEENTKLQLEGISTGQCNFDIDYLDFSILEG
ncbi:hypothetical protein QJS04_geneDACA006488 [Acorus gramineus]|uniref:Uncharacterized protein n=1 Tax=Acorus gramineus TaxID=55184 RepID=A0AAV9AZF4_ACOGR|nr:hypothetical protein QJS04_geneDACA006488 [Acorus gramineus]